MSWHEVISPIKQIERLAEHDTTKANEDFEEDLSDGATFQPRGLWTVGRIFDKSWGSEIPAIQAQES